MKQHIKKAIEILRNGGIIIYPTDTVYGIACRIDNENAVKKLFTIKRRSDTHAVPVLVDGIVMAQQYLLPIPKNVKEKLMDVYWPGGLTIILPCITKRISSLIRGDGENLGVREPNHKITLTLIHELGVPIIGTSANFHGERTPTKKEELDPEFIKLVDYVIPGKSYGGKSSTIIDCSISPWKVIREGAVKIET